MILTSAILSQCTRVTDDRQTARQTTIVSYLRLFEEFTVYFHLASAVSSQYA